MSIAIGKIVLAAIVLLLTTIATLRQNGRLTRWGKVLIAAALSSVLLEIVGTIDERRTEALEESRFRLSDLHFTLYAESLWSYRSDAEIRAAAPEDFSVNAWVGDFAVNFDFIGVRGVDRPTGYRAPNRATLVYHSANMRPAEFERGAIPFQYIWDLNGGKVRFTIPAGRFRPPAPERPWQFRSDLAVGANVVAREADAKGQFEFIVEALDRIGR